jgi:predicted transcriptional regulator of viral defense system
MKGKNISTQSGELLSYFNSQGKPCFSYKEAFEALPNANRSAIKELLSDMVRRGLLMRVKEGLYYIIPYEQEPETFMPDWHLLAECLVKDKNIEYYMGYYSALQIHQLITQPSLKEQIVVNQQVRPSVINIKNVPFQFIYHNKDHFFGAKNTWIDSYHKVKCSDLEKTFIDCLFKPDYAGGIVEIARALYVVREKLDYRKLWDYTQKFRSQAVIKRLGFLLELLEIRHPIIEQLQQAKSNAYTVLDTELPQEGKRSSRWNIQQNMDAETIKSAILT